MCRLRNIMTTIFCGSPVATFCFYKSRRHQVLNCLIFLWYMKPICLWAKKITIENVIALLQVLSSSFIFLTFTKCQNRPSETEAWSYLSLNTFILNSKTICKIVAQQRFTAEQMNNQQFWLKSWYVANLTVEQSAWKLWYCTPIALRSHKCSWVPLANINQ